MVLQSINNVSIQDSYPAIWCDRDVSQPQSNEIMAMSQICSMWALELIINGKEGRCLEVVGTLSIMTDYCSYISEFVY